ncbi:MAG: alpha/beta hydrolase [Bryobacteraceae bacterium]
MTISASKITSRAVLGLGAVAATLTASGALYQLFASKRDRKRHTASGRFIDVDGVLLHLNDQGEGSPTVVLEAGLTSMSAQWAWIQPEVAKFTRVVSYDRAGLGFSAASAQPRDAHRTAERLHALLQKAEIPAPYVIAAHSMGGLFARMFAHLYPDETAGLVLIDSVHPDQRRRAGAGADWQHSLVFGQLMAAPYLARVGVLRLNHYRAHMALGLPKTEADLLLAMSNAPSHLRGTSEEAAGFNAMCTQVRNCGTLGDLPLAVLSSESWFSEWDNAWHSLQREIAGLSTNSTFRIVPGSNHSSLITIRDHASEVIEAIRGIVDQVRNKYQLAA